MSVNVVELMPFASVVVVVLAWLDGPTLASPLVTVHVMVAPCTPLPLASSAWIVMGWKNCNVDSWHRHATWPSPDMIFRPATVWAVATPAPHKAASIVAITIILDRDKTSSWFRGTLLELGRTRRETDYNINRAAPVRSNEQKKR